MTRRQSHAAKVAFCLLQPGVNKKRVALRVNAAAKPWRILMVGDDRKPYEPFTMTREIYDGVERTTVDGSFMYRTKWKTITFQDEGELPIETQIVNERTRADHWRRVAHELEQFNAQAARHRLQRVSGNQPHNFV